MDTSEQNISKKDFFYQRYLNFTDGQVMEILRNHRNYQEPAVKAAVQIAVDRKLINSEQDLLAPEFQQAQSNGFTLFPEIADVYQRNKLIGSIFRFLYLLSLIPVVYGVLSYAKGEMDQVLAGVGAGLAWFLLCVLLNRLRKPFVFILLFCTLLLISVAVGQKVFSRETFVVLDLVMFVVGILLPVYFLFYLKKLLGTA
jgi:hypothetical protein